MSENENNEFDDDLSLSSHTLSALNEFFLEQQEQQLRFEQLKQCSSQTYSDTEHEDGKPDLVNEDNLYSKTNSVHMDVFREDWQGQEKWVSWVKNNVFALMCINLNIFLVLIVKPVLETTDVIIQEVLAHTNSESRIACISTPTVFVKLKSIIPPLKQIINLFEFDTRFDIYGFDFFQYDYKTPTKFRDCSKLRNTFDFIVVDPPFLSEDCFTKTMITVRWLGKKDNCAVMQNLADRLINARVTSFYPQHQGGLANEFRCYINYQSQNIK
ncbi:putative N6-adenine methyltransferase-domain-containing protein [Gigaspora rosea]|uniref:Putative N6-adenine methyltransferase-domain-containing protein n=1 Tax=Gigaspora rosea TaxID=44941 RepID=A0A397VDV3_9GLOM|nr:putative N6-adenine methyltransferase-domain-containing protein [Gigaspora rosea]